MGELVQFVPRPRSLPSERLHRLHRMITEARAQYQAIFPDEPRALGDWYAHTSDALGLVWGADDAAEDTAPCECNPSPENLA